ncbi:hypothetical protein GSB9_02038 [Flavobacteriaceae bacterium GSB9]|nr:hypothetical protein GSB9_02038 [Flavobacteriaceae bacterium GSB9]
MVELKLYHEIPGGRNKFHSAILTTYSFNFHHFEYQVLKTLKHKSIYNIGVLVDSTMLDNVLGASSAGLKQLTETYSINGVYARGAFHPKINFFIGDNHLMMVFGSGNITAGGHGKNHETFSALFADSSESPLLPILNEGWEYLIKLADNLEGYSGLRIKKVIPRNCTLIKPFQSEKHKFHKVDEDTELALLYNEDSSILNQLLALIPANEIDNITIVSPYYDEDGTFLKSILEEYSKSRVDVYLPKENGLPPTKMTEDKRIKFYQWENTNRGEKTINASEGYIRKLHSKLFFFKGKNYNYCLVGSANATKAAFGTRDIRGINEEFGMLYKSSKTNYLNNLGITGKKEVLDPSTLTRDKYLVNTAPITEKYQKSVKIESCDLDGLTLKCFFTFSSNIDNLYICFYNDIGEELSKFNQIITLTEKLQIRVAKDFLLYSPAYVLLKDQNERIISNKQVINNIAKLFNTDPSKENRAIRSMRSALEMGKLNEYSLLGYLNELSAGNNYHKDKTNTYSVSQEEKLEAHSEMTFEEAMMASKHKDKNQQLSTKHYTVQFWQTISMFYKEKLEIEQEELNDEEEEADATESNERKVADDKEKDISISQKAELKRIPESTETQANYFIKSLNIISRDSEIEINEVLLCQFLLISQIITAVHIFKSYDLPYDEKRKMYKFYTPEEWKKILQDKYHGLMQDILVTFAKTIINLSITTPEDDHRARNLNSYKQEVLTFIFLYHYFINRNVESPHSEISDLACLNILYKLGLPDNDGFKEYIENSFKPIAEKKYDAYAVSKLKSRIENLMNEVNDKTKYFYHKHYGVCHIIRKDSKKVFFKSIMDEYGIFNLNLKDL